ncbi:Hsp20/alpha crystallin family protein [Pseudohongiella sp. SYSU M77423]|uniref:Hsp20/alpha crystallin family protein n=1 Tax=Pseudohongiella sp. SYSU M77423 TaxID=3042312 RepID=UPI0024810FA5|nr:Hsp20/alpha crystallin family protein [Pseudohongiella sp. SYSU M77423]MDH7942364.1 Hsp20/alpha crystallin family protein [Pseudohongiella sp. SYSU M77423]
MNSRIISLMAAGLGLCLMLTAWLAWSNWQLQQQLDNMSSVQRDTSSSSEPGWLRRLETQDIPQNPPLTQSAPMTGWDPFAEMNRMQQQIDRWMQGATLGFGQAQRGSLFSATTAQPDIRIEEDTEAYRVRITVPEGSELELNTEVDDQRLTVSGAISSKVNETANGSTQRFFSSSQFSRQFTLNRPVDSLGMSKEATDNEVIITLPKV